MVGAWVGRGIRCKTDLSINEHAHAHKPTHTCAQFYVLCAWTRAVSGRGCSGLPDTRGLIMYVHDAPIQNPTHNGL